MNFPKIADAARLERLPPPSNRVSVIIDTDTAEPFSFAHHYEPLMEVDRARRATTGETSVSAIGEDQVLSSQDLLRPVLRD